MRDASATMTGKVMSEPLTPQTEIEALRQEVAILRHKLLQSQRLSTVGALASSVTHEFNNILTTVINYAKMGLRHKDANSRQVVRQNPRRRPASCEDHHRHVELCSRPRRSPRAV